MKKVAATSGQSVSFADLLFTEIMREEKLAGTAVMLLNLYRRPPKRFVIGVAKFFNELACEEYKVCTCMQEKNVREGIFFCS
jgi:hypothetical protein